MRRFFTWFNNIKIRYKSKRFIVPFIFILGFVFFPKDVFALDIHFYTSDYVVINSCYDCTSLSAPGVARVRFTYPTQLFQNLEYRFQFDTQFHYYNTTQLPTTHIGLFGANIEQNLGEYIWKGTIKEFPPNGGVLRGYSFDATWTQTTNGNNVFTEIYFDNHESYDLFSVVVDNYSLITTGDSTSDVIAGIGQQIIDNQNKNQQQTNEKLDKIDASINNDDTSSAEEKANGFFDNFKLEDNGGISSVVTMPLRIIEGLVSGSSSCQNLSFSVFDKDVYFPSGCILWGSAPDSIVVIYQTLICGLFGYILLIRLFKDIEALKNPNDSGVSTLDL